MEGWIHTFHQCKLVGRVRRASRQPSCHPGTQLVSQGGNALEQIRLGCESYKLSGLPHKA